ncbi:XdhC family protein [Novosphingobium sp. ZN18A2]|uniref:XdhC family protein n=1 Tax=Novosphingobium sp. ZN18A2 TaxID=3079861 RepID=UPI0030D62C63
MDNRSIFSFLDRALGDGRRVALVTLVSATGSSTRAPGAHMAVCEDGSFAGSLSGGCIERAVVGEALSAIREGAPRITRFGQGSRYIDIRLPCGGGVDLHFQPLAAGQAPGSALVHNAISALDGRHPFALEFGPEADAPRFVNRWCETRFDPATGIAAVGHWPQVRLMIAGHGAGVDRLARQGRTWGAEIAVATPDRELAAQLDADGFDTRVLRGPRDTGAIESDPWTAQVFLFHDHDWEPALIAHALRQPHFFIGAMGSRAAHVTRCRALRALGASEAALAGISAPVGLFHSVRDPETLALSILAEVAERHRSTDFATMPGTGQAAPTFQKAGQDNDPDHDQRPAKAN